MTNEQLLDELELYLRPPGLGIHAVSTGRDAVRAQTWSYMGWTEDQVPSWRDHLEQLVRSDIQVAIMAIPSDCGAGIVRGAAWGPQAIRRAWGTAPAFELGDVFSIPHFIDDPMLSQAQLDRSRQALYPHRPDRATLPVSPLSMAKRAMKLLKRLRPGLKVLLLGGDHTVTAGVLPSVLGPSPEDNRDFAIVHFDAHTDLLRDRLGVSNCFATWAHHANESLGGGRRLLQIGIRASAHDRQYWEKHEDVRQIWAEEARELGPEGLAREVAAHLASVGARRVYVSNDLDGTDAEFAAACGTPEPDGLHPDHVRAVLKALGEMDVQVLGADVVELAPGLSLDREASQRSIETARDYADRSLQLLAG